MGKINYQAVVVWLIGPLCSIALGVGGWTYGLILGQGDRLTSLEARSAERNDTIKTNFEDIKVQLHRIEDRLNSTRLSSNP
jgi:hypothetical protein